MSVFVLNVKALIGIEKDDMWPKEKQFADLLTKQRKEWQYEPIHNFCPIKITLDNSRSYDIYMSMPSLHNIYSANSSVDSKSPSRNIVNLIYLARRGTSPHRLGFFIS
jgi:hypothetical protein